MILGSDIEIRDQILRLGIRYWD